MEGKDVLSLRYSLPGDRNIRRFINKYSVSYKEADETDYWINMLHDNGYLNDEQYYSLNADCERILKVLTSIIKSLKSKLLISSVCWKPIRNTFSIACVIWLL